MSRLPVTVTQIETVVLSGHMCFDKTLRSLRRLQITVLLKHRARPCKCKDRPGIPGEQDLIVFMKLRPAKPVLIHGLYPG